MTGKLIVLKTVLLFLSAVFCYAQTVIISQVDNSSLLMDQKIKVYASVTDEYGNPITNLTQEQFELYEAVPDKQAEKRDIIFFLYPVENINRRFLAVYGRFIHIDHGRVFMECENRVVIRRVGFELHALRRPCRFMGKRMRETPCAEH